MDIHGCRFVPFPPSPINALAFSHNHIEKKGHNIQARLAIGRANGDLEIWNPLDTGRWMQETIIHGGKDRSIDGLVWANDLDEPYGNSHIIYGRSRLFSIGFTSAITEWDLEKRVAKRHASGQHGDIWCFALQPFSPETLSTPFTARTPEDRILVAGTADGSLVAYSVEDDDLRFHKVLVKIPKKKSRILSITFQRRNTVVVGQSGGAVTIYDLRRGSSRKLSLDYKSAGNPSSLIVWAASCLPNARRDIVVGDSSGHLSIFHGKNYTLLQRINGHKQDILSLSVSHDGCSIASGGMDRRTVVYRKSPNDANRWEKSFHNRDHEHDVKAIASFASPKMDVFVTGGSDTAPVVVPFAKAGLEPRRTLSHLPQDVPVATAPEARLVVSWWDREVRIWQLRRSVMENMLQTPSIDGKIEPNHKLLSHILIKGDASITSASISQDGSLLIVATSLETKAFRLKVKADLNGKETIRPSKINIPDALRGGCSKIQISPDGNWVCLVREGRKLYMAKIFRNSETPISIHPKMYRLNRSKRTIPKFIQLGGLGSYDRGITHIAFSPDSRMLATADLAGYIDSWVMKGPDMPNGVHDDTDADSASSASDSDDEATPFDKTWKRNPNGLLIPKLPSPPAVLSFAPIIPSRKALIASKSKSRVNGDAEETSEVSDYILLTVTGSGQTRAFHPNLGKLTDWTRRNPYIRFPEPYTKNRDIAKGVVWQGSRAWIWGVSFLFMIDMSKDFPAPVEETNEKALVKSKKRKRERQQQQQHGAFKPLGSKSVKMSKPGKDGFVKWEEVADKDDEQLAETDEDDDETVGELMALRGRDEDSGKDGNDAPLQAGTMAFWATRKYRPILGLLPIGDDSGKDNDGQMEVVLIERPLWDVGMPDRLFGDEEWERR
ncbi:hypothetical protein MKZ38_009551 [Zalerion maritima]|uniref:Uncharacterized protein n=1 Tax=Zalerion maritima TaxID=339359 RepID=A0AAD5RG61_9PEZI|nr:hypothetical protein MKZ38_009551 [Zalerion maritima]